MPLRIEAMRQAPTLAGRSVFLAASIPEPARWEGDFDPLEITDAVASAARAVLTSSGTVVTAAHPTIAPLLLYLAAEFPASDRPGVVVYQSRLFESVLPQATRRFAEAGFGDVRWTDAVQGDIPEPGRWDQSLLRMRETLLTETQPVAAIFIGGMGGIPEEHALFRQMLPQRPWYAIGRPGGAARDLSRAWDGDLQAELLDGAVYPSMMRRVVADISRSLENEQT